MSAAPPPFHLAFAVDDLTAARRFYGEILGCREGRSSDRWIDFDLAGHQIVTHLVPGVSRDLGSNPVDGHGVPIPHFGLVLAWDDWTALAERLRAAEVGFALEPYVRFEGLPGEQGTFFVRDPAGNALEFKAMRNPDQLFAT